MKITFSSTASSFYKTPHPSSTPLLTDSLLIFHHRRLSPLHRHSRSSITPLPQSLSFSINADEFRYLLHVVFCRCSLKLVSVVAAAFTSSSRRRRYGKLSMNELPSFFSSFDLVVASPVEDYFLYIDDLKNPDKEEVEKITQPYLDALGEDYSVCCQGTAFFPLQSCMNHSCSSNAKAFKRDEDRDGQATIIAVRPIRKGKEVGFVNTAGSALEHIKRTHEAVNEKKSKHISAAVSLISNASNSNEQHGMEINSARVATEEDVAKNSKDLFEQFDGKDTNATDMGKKGSWFSAITRVFLLRLHLS
ncbi:hypothetical protein Ahy_B01g054883 [Arachis hypogaea]|uniref:SET domain-containing protein n=1 Tax=Arachis hypogaea TaxID=3818 RepID=A0A445AUE8_ARAHY|nr:hypothetical protein Ahy_B01g054883 [Arachis hypogaea]